MRCIYLLSILSLTITVHAFWTPLDLFAYPINPNAPFEAMSSKNVIVQLHKGLSDEDKTKFLEEIKGKGAQIVKDDNKDSSIMPFVVVSISPDHYNDLQSASLKGHDVVKHVEEDGEMHIQ